MPISSSGLNTQTELSAYSIQGKVRQARVGEVLSTFDLLPILLSDSASLEEEIL